MKAVINTQYREPKYTMKKIFTIYFLFLAVIISCEDENVTDPDSDEASTGWTRFDGNPVFRDTVENVDYNYEVASDAHIFLDENQSLKMIYSGDVNERISIKLASGSSWQDWKKEKPLLFQPNSAGTDVYKETAFYRKSSTGKHQIYYVGYEKEETYEAQIFLAEADSLNGPYYQHPQPIVPKGTIAGKDVYCMTSPSILEYEDKLYMIFIGWNAPPNEVPEVWIIGAISFDNGYNWTDFQLVDTKIGMEGQVTKTSEGKFIAVRTGEYKHDEAIFYSTANHPFGPWTESKTPILTRAGAPWEVDEIIAPQITIDETTGDQYLYYTGADHQKGWWIMLAIQNSP